MTRDELYDEMLSGLLSRLDDMGVDTPCDKEIKEVIDEMLEEKSAFHLSVKERLSLSGALFASVRELDVLQEFMDDPDVTEIMINGPDNIFIEKGGRLTRSKRTFRTGEKLEDVIQQIVGRCNRVVNERIPIADARLPDGSRVNAVISPVALNGPILTIRRFPREPITMEKLISYGTITPEADRFISTLVSSGYSIIVSGGTSAGKTTFLNVLSDRIPKSERIITIEDNAELQIRGIENLVRLEAKNANMEGNTEITIRDLIKSALRMRPDRIIVGEVRGGEAVDMLQAMNTGHDGSMSTIHSNSCFDTLSRLETMVLMAFPLPLPAIRSQIASGIDILVHLGRLKDNSRKVLEIAEVRGIKDSDIVLGTLFKYNPVSDTLERTGPLENTFKLERLGITIQN